ncbi:MAG TPA: anaerobic ribonucleoside-triphosphate reductase activating protein [Kiritimatiellia bacterium]|nr:anaerobic ribonucleoside-triphosphate reductase activating protein [Kiritimatiellia bacterium]
MNAATDNSPVFGILQNASMVDYPGRMAAVLFLSGCNFRCGFCHNAKLMGRVVMEGLSWADVEATCRKFRENWVQSMVVTGGEPTLHPGIFELVDRLKGWGFAVKLDTNGSRPEVLEELLPQVDYVAMDVKFAPEEYEERTGFGRIEALSRSMDLIRGTSVGYEFRTTVIDAWHNEDKMRAIGEWVRGARRHVLQGFVPHENLPDPSCRVMKETPSATLHRLADVLRGYVEQVDVRGEF